MSKMKVSALALLAAAGLSGCFDQPEYAGNMAAPARLPSSVCKQAADALRELSERGTFEHSDSGEATLAQEAWLQLGAAERDQLTQLLGYHAACKAPEPSAERTVLVRSENGQVLSRRIVSTSADLSKLLEE